MDSGNPSEVACRVATSGVPKTSETLFGYKKRSALVGKKINLIYYRIHEVLNSGTKMSAI
jgi:hypothetical protein